MRWIFIGVVALNLGYLAWHLLGPEASAPAATVEIPPQAFPATLVRLEERGEGVASVAPPSGPLPPTPLAGCPAVGPFPSSEEARPVLEALAAGGHTAADRLVEATDVPVYWVYLPPAPTRETAQRRLRELHDKGIDSFIVAQGEDVNAISLGSFQNRDSAMGIHDRLRAAGYPVVIREQRKTLRQHWLVLADPAAQGFSERLPAGIELQYRRLPCD